MMYDGLPVRCWVFLERVAERACGDTWRNIRDDLGQVELAQLSGHHGDVWQVTEPAPDARHRLKSLKIDIPPRSSSIPEQVSEPSHMTTLAPGVSTCQFEVDCAGMRE